MLAVVLAAIVVAGLSTLLRSSLRDYSNQTNITDLHQNAHATMKKMTDIIMEAGADLPPSGFNLVTVPGPGDVLLAINTKSGLQIIGVSLGIVQKLPVENGNGFTGCDSVMVVFNDKTRSPAKIAIDTGYSAAGYVRGIRTDADPDTVMLAPHSISLASGDIVYPFTIHRYFKNGLNICLNDTSNVVAENIDSFSVAFKKRNGETTSVWDSVYFATLAVTVRSGQRDPALKNSKDGYKRVKLSMDFRLRNRI